MKPEMIWMSLRNKSEGCTHQKCSSTPCQPGRLLHREHFSIFQHQIPFPVWRSANLS
ncbi:hypothetical protein Hanom_Chr08g00706131 [Helianthus anomalus]